MNNIEMFIDFLKSEEKKATEERQSLIKLKNMRYAYVDGRADAFFSAIIKAELLLKTSHESNHSKAPIAQTQMLGEVPPEVETSTIEATAGALCETGGVRQNEQTKEVCPHCNGDEFTEFANTICCMNCGNSQRAN